MQENSLGRYTIVRELGRGAISTVHAARDSSTGAVVALKTLDPALLGAGDEKLAELFLENARSAARLRHANIVKVLDAGEAGGVAYVLMELVEGKSLRQVLDERPLPLARAIRIFDDVASALAYAHEEGMVHRGVRPSNIFILPSGIAKIGDFGLGQIGEAAVRYMSPEQVRGDPVELRTDLFSLGAVFYEMLTRRAPFGGHSPKEIRQSILSSEPPRPSAVNPNVPAALDQLLLGLLARRPDDRVASARDLLRELQRVEEALGLRPGAPAAAPKTEPTLNIPRFSPHLEAEAGRPSGPTLRADPSQLEEFRDHREARFGPEPKRRSGSPSNALAALALVLAVLSIGLAVFSRDLPRLDELRTLFSRGQEAPPAATAAPATVAAPPPQAAPPAPLPVAEPIKPQPIAPAVPEKLPPATVAAAKQEEPPSVAPAPQPAGTAKLSVAIAPRGEIYIDGKHAGTTPPITTLDLEPGMHRIEIRSGSRRPYLTYMVVEPGEQRRVRYDFNARGRPPA